MELSDLEPNSGLETPIRDACVGLAFGVAPERIRRHDRVRRLVVDRVAQRDREAALGRLDRLAADVLEALRITTEAEPPWRLDRARWCVLDALDQRPPLAAPDLEQCVLGRRLGARVAVAIEGHARKAAVGRDR